MRHAVAWESRNCDQRNRTKAKCTTPVHESNPCHESWSNHGTVQVRGQLLHSHSGQRRVLAGSADQPPTSHRSRKGLQLPCWPKKSSARASHGGCRHCRPCRGRTTHHPVAARGECLIVAETQSFGVRPTTSFQSRYQWPEWHAERPRSGWATFRSSHILQDEPSTARRAGLQFGPPCTGCHCVP